MQSQLKYDTNAYTRLAKIAIVIKKKESLFSRHETSFFNKDPNKK